MSERVAKGRMVAVGSHLVDDRVVPNLMPWGFTKEDPRKLKRKRRAANRRARRARRVNRAS